MLTRTRATAIADDLRAAAEQATQVMASIPAERWTRLTAAEGWTVGRTVRHIALGLTTGDEWIRTMVSGRPVTMTAEELDARNAAQGEPAFAERDLLVRQLRDNLALSCQLIEGLSEADLDRTGVFAVAGGEMSVERLSGAQARHIRLHLAGISTAVGG